MIRHALTCSASLVLACLSACTAPRSSATYEAPTLTAEDPSQWTVVVERSFDQVWTALIDHASSSYFGIDKFEKESGLLTLTFGASSFEDFVDGGHWSWASTAGYVQHRGQQPTYVEAAEFEGNYARYLEEYIAPSSLIGRMNVFVRERGPTETEVRVTARYVLTSGKGAGKRQWAFNTGGSDTVTIRDPTKGTPSARTFRPTHRAERSITDAVTALAQDDGG